MERGSALSTTIAAEGAVPAPAIALAGSRGSLPTRRRLSRRRGDEVRGLSRAEGGRGARTEPAEGGGEVRGLSRRRGERLGRGRPGPRAAPSPGHRRRLDHWADEDPALVVEMIHDDLPQLTVDAEGSDSDPAEPGFALGEHTHVPPALIFVATSRPQFDGVAPSVFSPLSGGLNFSEVTTPGSPGSSIVATFTYFPLLTEKSSIWKPPS